MGEALVRPLGRPGDLGWATARPDPSIGTRNAYWLRGT